MANETQNKMPINSRTYESLKADFRKLSSEMNSGMVTAKDINGNVFRVDIDDPRYLSGELVGIRKGMIITRDSEGNNISVSVDDPRYISGELFALNIGMIGVKDMGGNTFRVSIKDPKYISGEYVPITKGMTWEIKDTRNYRKPKSKEHVENMKKWASVTDPTTMESKRVLRTDPLYVSGYYKGPSFGKIRSRESKEKMSMIMTGKKQDRCCCIGCGAEISVNNLHRHYGSRKCAKRIS